MNTIIYHNPRCSASRSTLELIRAAGIEPQVIEYLKTPLAPAALRQLIAAAGLSVRQAMREKEAVFAELGLADQHIGEQALLDAMQAHPVLLNRPFVVTPLGTRLCRPAETVAQILPPA
ncbi:MAG: arsenate reductase (glutaredoxin) [Janthinobacterium lividum]